MESCISWKKELLRFFFQNWNFKSWLETIILQNKWIKHWNHRELSELINLLKTLIHPESWNFISRLGGTPSKLAPCSDSWSFLLEWFLTSSKVVSCSLDNLLQLSRKVLSWNITGFNKGYRKWGKVRLHKNIFLVLKYWMFLLVMLQPVVVL